MRRVGEVSGTRRTVLGGVVAVGGAWAAACGSAATPAAQTPDKLAPATLRVLYRAGQYEIDLYGMRNPVFEQKYAGVKVELESTAGSDHYTKTLALAAGGTLSDLVWSSVGSGGYFSFVVGKLVRQLDDVVTRDKFDLKQYYETSIKSLRREGKLYGVPVLCHPSISMLWMNQSALESRAPGTLPDKTWTLDQLTEYAKRLTKNTGDPASATWGYSVYTAPRGIKCLALAGGNDTFSADGKKSLFTSDAVATAVTWQYDLMYKHRVAPTPDDLKGVQGGLNTLFGNGRSPMTRSSTSFLQTAQQQVQPPAKYWASMHPKPVASKGNPAVWESDVWTIGATTKFVEQAWKLVLHYTDKDSGLALAKLTGSLNGRPDVWHAPEILNEHPIRKVMVESMESAQQWTPPYNTRFPEYEAKMTELLTPVWAGKEAPTRSYLAECDRQLQEVLNLPAPGSG